MSQYHEDNNRGLNNKEPESLVVQQKEAVNTTKTITVDLMVHTVLGVRRASWVCQG